MRIISIRRLTNDGNHNAFTGACWFQGALYVAFRQGDAHACNQGRLVVMRSRDRGVSYDTMAILRGEFDTRDAHLYSAGDKRLFLTGFEFSYSDDKIFPGTAWTDDGIHWTCWQRMKGDVTRTVMWRPLWFRGHFYCAGYHSWGLKDALCGVSWFESEDGLAWRKQYLIHEGTDEPSECFLDFMEDGSAIMIMRRDSNSCGLRPLLCRSVPPYREWTKTELDIPLAGPAIWHAGNDIWISGRWFPTSKVYHTAMFVNMQVAVFRIVDDKPFLQYVLPSGGDCSYMGVAKAPDNHRRFFLSYYSGHAAPADPRVDQWTHPDIYVADVLFDVHDAEFIKQWKVSALQKITGGLSNARCPDPDDNSLGWRDIETFNALDENLNERGFANACSVINQQSGIVYFVADVNTGSAESGYLMLGHDGPIRVWFNEEQIYEGAGNNPAIADQLSLPVRFCRGNNRITVALDTNGGKAWGIFGRIEI